MALLRRISNLFRRVPLNRDIDAELQSHIDLRTDENMARGMSPEEARREAINTGCDTLIVDTAGRLHTKTGLMAELDKMRRTAQRIIPDAPHEVLLVLDATTGQNGLQQARLFTESAGVTGIVLTKLDGTAKGGIAVAIAREMKLPVLFVGVGEALEDLLPFDSSAFVNSLLAA